MYQSRYVTVLNAKNTYNTVSDRIADYKSMLEAFHEKVLNADASNLRRPAHHHQRESHTGYSP